MVGNSVYVGLVTDLRDGGGNRSEPRIEIIVDTAHGQEKRVATHLDRRCWMICSRRSARTQKRAACTCCTRR